MCTAYCISLVSVNHHVLLHTQTWYASLVATLCREPKAQPHVVPARLYVLYISIRPYGSGRYRILFIAFTILDLWNIIRIVDSCVAMVIYSIRGNFWKLNLPGWSLIWTVLVTRLLFSYLRVCAFYTWCQALELRVFGSEKQEFSSVNQIYQSWRRYLLIFYLSWIPCAYSVQDNQTSSIHDMYDRYMYSATTSLS